ncbi:unnamed protein product [Lupinus luteus]|uniref:Uncharacterized protein n=1 Tax=Lupinus luteus TaxID=3873 RepID=A0AAV1W1D6_LUPLU
MALYHLNIMLEGNPTKDPVVLWLNGGPGCSSLDGFVYEHGPFNFEKPKTKGTLPKLQLNPYSWSKVSNIIYLDSPAGVGFSYSKNKTDYNTGDFQTASDTHHFLLEWFKLYPEFLPNPLFISGESFAGIYVPTLAHEIVKGIDSGVKPKLNFKGYLIGNGVTDKKFDGNALVPFAHGMGLISDQLFETVTTICKGKFYGIPDTQECRSAIGQVFKNTGYLNIYDILEPCYHDSSEKLVNATNIPLSFRELGKTERPMPVRKRMFGRAWPLGAPVEDGIVPNWPQLSAGAIVQCVDDEVATAWLNNEAVRKAIHTVDKSVVSEWVLCTNNLLYHHDAGSMIEYHRNLTSKGYRALIFRYTIAYDKNLTFMTIKGAGHTVPEYKPKESFTRKFSHYPTSRFQWHFTFQTLCWDDEVATEWLNNDAVRKAIHTVEAANTTCKGNIYDVPDAPKCTSAMAKVHLGYLIGNGVTDKKFDGNALVPFAHGMGLISDQLFEAVTTQCKGKFYGIPDTLECKNAIGRVYKNIGNLNIYDILEPCYHDSSEKLVNATNLPLSFRELGKTERPMPVRKRMFGRAWPLGAPVDDGFVPSWPQLSAGGGVPCVDDEVATAWLNNEAVRKAIHTVDKSVVSEWMLCTDNLFYNHNAGSMIEYHKNLTSKGYRALVFSGDHDMCVPYTGSQAWTRAMGYSIVDDWRPWLVDDQVGGYFYYSFILMAYS